MTITPSSLLLSARGVRIRPFGIISICVTLMVGCDSPPSRTSDIDAAPQGAEKGWRMADTVLRIGQEGNADYEFGHIVGLGRLKSGDWVVYDRGPRQLRYYSSTGAFLRKAGRAGDGPGEFRDVFFMRVVDGSTIYTYDQILRRLTLWSADGHVKRTILAFVPKVGSILQASGPVNENMFVWTNVLTPACVEKAVTFDTVTFYSMSLRERLPRSSELVPSQLAQITRIPGRPSWGSSLNVLNRCLPQSTPFTPGPLAAVQHGELQIVERTGVKLIRHRFVDNTTSSVIVPIARRPLTKAMIESYVQYATRSDQRDEMGRPLPPGPGNVLYARRLAEFPYPDSLPAVDQLVIDLLGHTWLRHHTLPGEVSTWTVVNQTSQVIAHMDTPSALTVFEIGTDYVAGVERDSLDVEQVVVRRLVRGR